jgi:nitroimidazol reductase NimA-like FMN-containing flavoprotein (pyridoxamine 5'-phosphate oxidase superfamily)
VSVTTMSGEEREAFLADRHVGVLSVTRAGRGPLTVPIWYTYEPGGLVSVITGASTRKAQLIADAGRFSLCAQSETPPYKYVSVEGPVTSSEEDVDPDEAKAVAYRYLGQEFGDLYLAATAGRAAGNRVIRMRPESWLASDYAKEYGG